jgi:hypothetical protein
MKTYVLNGNTHMCFDDEMETIISVTNSPLMDNSAIAYTKDTIAFKGLFDTIISAVTGSYEFGEIPPFTFDTEENFNAVKEFVLNKLNNTI